VIRLPDAAKTPKHQNTKMFELSGAIIADFDVIGIGVKTDADPAHERNSLFVQNQRRFQRVDATL
jgi:hypothetical protein